MAAVLDVGEDGRAPRVEREQVEFRFPIVAIAGENGSGKSTILKAAASAYLNDEKGEAQGAKTFNPDDFFPKTQWENVSG